MSGAIAPYLEAKYGGGGPGSGRFMGDFEEVHASRLSACQRKRHWKLARGHRDGASPYFELGRMYEMLYGAALAFEHDPDIGADDLSRLKPWEVSERSTRVHQDVNVTIHLDGCRIVGECDWVVLTDDLAFDEVVVHADGSRTALSSGSGRPYEGNVLKVVETKTKSSKRMAAARRDGPDLKHVYQVYPYMHALDCPGEIAYMCRNDWSEHVVPLELDEEFWLDCLIRAREHAGNGADAPLPPTTPIDGDECHWCPFSDECEAAGGSVWQ